MINNFNCRLKTSKTSYRGHNIINNCVKYFIELNQVLPHLINLKKPTYIRLTGLAKNKPVHDKDFEIDFHSPLEIFSGGNDLLVLSLIHI